jgi:hypothetical protein
VQGASLSVAQLQGGDLSNAQLQGASLAGAQLHGAVLTAGQLQGASLSDAQLQVADLRYAHLQGALLDNVFVWRAKPPKKEDMAGALVDAPEAGPRYQGRGCHKDKCVWSAQSFLALKSLIEKFHARRLRA